VHVLILFSDRAHAGYFVAWGSFTESKRPGCALAVIIC
jgi:hypothetical protein